MVSIVRDVSDHLELCIAHLRIQKENVRTGRAYELMTLVMFSAFIMDFVSRLNRRKQEVWPAESSITCKFHLSLLN